MPTSTQGRRLQYRLARFHGFNKTPLQTVLSKSLRAQQDPANRLESTDQSGAYRLINLVSAYGGTLCGNMFAYNKGASQLLMREQRVKNDDDAVSSYPLEALAAPTDGGARAEFLDSILYFCIRGGHVLLMQSQGLRAKSFEQYLNWLLQKSGDLSSDQMLFLGDKPTTAFVTAIRNTGVKSVVLGMPLAKAQPVVAQQKRAAFTLSGPFVGMLREIIGPRLDHMKLEDALDGNIQATIELRWKRQTTEPAQEVLDNLAIAMRNIEPEDVHIQLNNGSTLDGSELKVAVPVDVQTRDGIVLQAQLFKAMREAMRALIEDGTIGA